MKRAFGLLFVSCLFVVAACQNSNLDPIPVNKGQEKQILFFSDDNDVTNEVDYYDALLALKSAYPNEINGLKVLTYPQHKNCYDEFNISMTPSIIVLFENEVILYLNEDFSKEDIISSLDLTLSRK